MVPNICSIHQKGLLQIPLEGVLLSDLLTHICILRIGWAWIYGMISLETAPWYCSNKTAAPQKAWFQKTMFWNIQQVTASGPPNSWSIQTRSRHRGKNSKNEDMGCSNKMQPLRQTTTIISSTTLSDTTNIENNMIIQRCTSNKTHFKQNRWICFFRDWDSLKKTSPTC